MIDFKLKEVKRFLGKVTELKWQTSYLNYYNNFWVKLVDVICIFTYLYIYIYIIKTFETLIIFHVSTILTKKKHIYKKKNLKTKKTLKRKIKGALSP